MNRRRWNKARGRFEWTNHHDKGKKKKVKQTEDRKNHRLEEF